MTRRFTRSWDGRDEMEIGGRGNIKDGDGIGGNVAGGVAEALMELQERGGEDETGFRGRLGRRTRGF